MTWVLVILLWSRDGSTYDEYAAYRFNSLMGCQAQMAYLKNLETLPSTAEEYCIEGKYYPTKSVVHPHG